MAQVWAGVDTGKTHHHCVVIDPDGRRLLSRRVANDEQELLALLAAVPSSPAPTRSPGRSTRPRRCRAADRAAAGPRPAAAVHPRPERQPRRRRLPRRGQDRRPRRGDLADQARMRRDLTPFDPATRSTELQLLTSRRADLVADRTRTINRLRGLLTRIFPALERALDLTRTGPLVLLAGYQTPAALRAISAAAWRPGGYRKVRAAAARRRGGGGRPPAIGCAAGRDPRHAARGDAGWGGDRPQPAGPRPRRADRGPVPQHKLAPVIASLPGIGTLLGAEFLAATGGDMAYFGTPDRLAAFAGLAPAPWDSGRLRGNLHRPRRYHRRLQRVFYYSALVSIGAVWNPAASTTASGPRANATPRPCWPWPDGASTSCGRCCATSDPTGHTTSRRRRLTRSPDITPTA